MIIKSNFKDFYDFVAYQYGTDPKIVYNRVRLSPLIDNSYDTGIKIPSDVNIRDIPNTRFDRNLSEKDVPAKWLIIAGKYYLLVKSNNTYLAHWELYSKERHPYITGMFRENIFGDRIDGCNISGGIQYDHLIELSRKHNAPVFCIIRNIGNRKNPYKIEGAIPILSNIIGAAAYFDPFILYQDISYFISNTMNINPDIVPPVEIGNNDKIVGHGFDLKQSFRHRKQ